MTSAAVQLNSISDINRCLVAAIAEIDKLENFDHTSSKELDAIKNNLSNVIQKLREKNIRLENLESGSFVDNKILTDIMNQMIEYAELNFSSQLEMDSEDDVINTMATTVNLLGEELEDKIKKLQQLNITLEVTNEDNTAKNQEFTGIMKALDNSALIFITDIKGILVKVNKGFCEASKYKETELLGETPKIINSGYHSEDFWKSMWTQIENGKAWRDELKCKAKDGSFFWMDVVINPITDIDGEITHYLAISNLITDKKIQETRLIENDKAIRKSLEEKEILLQEVHHRVKNNLQMISSLMELQIRRAKDDEVKQQLFDSQKRVKAMSVLHEKLYKADNISQIDISEYTKNLIASYVTMYQSERTSNILVKSDIEGGINISIGQAIPYGLIFNEIISNCYKHAFKEDESGNISISLRQVNNKTQLIVKDSGKGMSKKVNLKTLKSLGIKLITTLAKQLNAEVNFENKKGLEVSILFN